MDQGRDHRRYQKAKEILQRAVDAAPADRRAWLDEACGGDTELRAEVDSLLVAYDQANSQFLAAPSPSLIDEVEPPSDEIDLAGTRVGAYRLDRLLGRGGMGAVYLASRADGEFTKHVAVKFILPSIATPAVLKRFRAERQMLADIDHPNIARLIDGGTADGGMPFFIMEYVKGETLTDTLARGPLPVESAVRLATTVADVLEAIHARGLVFRDLKPSNIMLTPDSGTKLLDFGIAKIVRDDSGEQTTTSTEPGWIIGSPRYMSPEQATGAAVDARSDVFSFGVVTYEALTGRLPFDGKTRHEYVNKLLSTEPAPMPANVPGNLRAIVERCLKKEPSDRFPSGKELAAAVRAVAAPAAPPQKTSNRALWAAIAVLAIGLGALVAYQVTRPGTTQTLLLQGPPKLIATWNSNETIPRISPNGRWVSFISNRDGNTKLWLIELANNSDRFIAPLGGEIKWHEWSPASDAIAYTTSLNGQTRLTIASLGNEAPREFEFPHHEVALVRWIKNRIYYLHGGRTGGSLWRYDLVARRSEEMTTKRGDMRLRGVDVSSDQRYIIFSASEGDLASLWYGPIDGSAPARLTEDRINPRYARWKGGSTREVVYVSDEGEMVDIWQIDVTTKERWRLTNSDAHEGFIDVSADGSQLFYEQVMQRSNLGLVDPSQQNPVLVPLTSDTLGDLQPSASESGNEVVFQRSRVMDMALGARTSTVRLDRNAFRGQPEIIGEGYAPEISKDGQWVAYSKWTPTSSDHLWIANTSDRNQKPIPVSETLARPGAAPSVPWFRQWAVIAWAPGSTLYFVNRRDTGPEIWKFSPKSGQPAQPVSLVPRVGEPSARITDLHVSPDGNRLSYIVWSVSRGTYDLFVLDFARNRVEVEFHEKTAFKVGSAGWTNDGAVVVLRADQTGTLTDIVLVKDSRHTEAGRIRDATWANFALDPGRRVLFFTRETDAVHSLHEKPFDNKPERQLIRGERHGAGFSGLRVLRNGQILLAAQSENFNIQSNAFVR